MFYCLPHGSHSKTVFSRSCERMYVSSKVQIRRLSIQTTLVTDTKKTQFHCSRALVVVFKVIETFWITKMVQPRSSVEEDTDGQATQRHPQMLVGLWSKGKLLLIKSRFHCQKADSSLNYFSSIIEQNKLHQHNKHYTRQKHKRQCITVQAAKIPVYLRELQNCYAVMSTYCAAF